MSVSLSKGGKVSLSKQAPGLREVAVTLGWDEGEGDFDLDASAFMLNSSGKVLSDQHFVFYGSALKLPDGKIPSPDGSVIHTGDDLTGGTGETINVDLTRVPPDVERIAFTVTIHEAEQRGQHFGLVSDAFIRVENLDGGKEITRYDLAEDASGETAMTFGELYRSGNEWEFRAVGQGTTSGLRGLCLDFGVNVE